MLLLDNSAWARLTSPGLSEERSEAVAGWLERGELAVSLPFLLEAGYSARSGPGHRAMMADLRRLPCVHVARTTARLALDAQAELASVGHHSVAPADIIIAACAHEAGTGVLHYDRDYDLIAGHAGLELESEWLAPAGTL